MLIFRGADLILQLFYYFLINFIGFVVSFPFQVLADALPQEQSWRIQESVDEVKAATAILPLKQPRELLSLKFCDSMPKAELQELAAVLQTSEFEGKLSLDLRHSSETCDEMVKQLKEAK